LRSVHKTKYLGVNTSLMLASDTKEYNFASFMNRDQAYELIQSMILREHQNFFLQTHVEPISRKSASLPRPLSNECDFNSRIAAHPMEDHIEDKAISRLLKHKLSRRSTTSSSESELDLPRCPTLKRHSPLAETTPILSSSRINDSETCSIQVEKRVGALEGKSKIRVSSLALAVAVVFLVFNLIILGMSVLAMIRLDRVMVDLQAQALI
ncbi:hypothetical protein HDU98_011834, partial [Podochytrium sp. JEL0797]